MLARFPVRRLCVAGTRRRWFTASAEGLEDALERQELAKRAHKDIQIARRRRREADDEMVLCQSAAAAGFIEAEGKDPERRRRAIDQFYSERAETVMASIAAGRMREVVPFSLEVAPSEDLPQPIAGDGVFVKDAEGGEIPAGTLLAFYPGSVYLPHEVRWLGGDGPMLERAGQHTSSHVIGRVGGILIDGLWSGIQVPASEFDLDEEALSAVVAKRIEMENVTSDSVKNAVRADVEAYCAGLRNRRRTRPKLDVPDHCGQPEKLRAQNPLAVGEMINHPPEGRPANVMGWPMDLDIFGKGYEHLAPNTYALRPEGMPGPGAPCPHTVIMVAAHTLRPGDELYLDYGCELLELEDIPVWFAPAALRGDAVEKDPAKNPAIAVRDELHAWRQQFEARHGRKPTRHDLASDKVAAALFESFQKYRKLGDL